MTRVTNHFLPVLRALLFTWLVLAQASAFAHELSHDGAGEPEVCATCSVGQVLQAGSCSSADVWLPVEKLARKPGLTPTPLVSFSPAPSRARGPPVHS